MAAFKAGVFQIDGQVVGRGQVHQAAGGLVQAVHEGLPGALAGDGLPDREFGQVEVKSQEVDGVVQADGIDADGVVAQDMVFSHLEGEGLLDRGVPGFAGGAGPLPGVDAFPAGKEGGEGYQMVAPGKELGAGLEALFG